MFILHQITLEDCNFIGNYADEGGAVYFENNLFNNIVDDCNFTNNQADKGAAIMLSSSKELLSNSIFTDNTAKSGPAIYLEYSSTLSINDCVVNDKQVIFNKKCI